MQWFSVGASGGHLAICTLQEALLSLPGPAVGSHAGGAAGVQELLSPAHSTWPGARGSGGAMGCTGPGVAGVPHGRCPEPTGLGTGDLYWAAPTALVL